ncbi:hypothetical protein [Stenotrophomonas geniculata]
MARQIIDIDTVQPNGKKGDPARLMSQKVNANFAELYPALQVAGANMLINCGIPINQRGFAGGALAAGVYGYDRWKGGVGGGNVTVNATTGAYTHTSGAWQQIVEAPQRAWGQPLTFSVEDPTGTITVNVGGTIGTIAAGSGRKGVTITPSGSGNMLVQISATGVTYARPKLERGGAATSFEQRPLTLELLLCQRYYCKSFPVGTAPATGLAAGIAQNATAFSSADVRTGRVQFPVEMRTIPSITLYTSNDANTQGTGRAALWNGSQWNSNANWSYDSISAQGFGVNGNFGSGLAVNSSWLMRFNYTADAEI